MAEPDTILDRAADVLDDDDFSDFATAWGPVDAILDAAAEIGNGDEDFENATLAVCRHIDARPWEIGERYSNAAAATLFREVAIAIRDRREVTCDH